jgi:hypothetical protein
MAVTHLTMRDLGKQILGLHRTRVVPVADKSIRRKTNTIMADWRRKVGGGLISTD